MSFFKKPSAFSVFYGVILAVATVFVLLDTFVIPKPIHPVTAQTVREIDPVFAATSSDAKITTNFYSDDKIQIKIETQRKYDTTIYVADIQIADIGYLKTAFANDVFGRNITDTTSNIAADNQAILAINGDYCGFRNEGYVIRNGILYRDIKRKSEDEALVIDSDGNMYIVNEQDISAEKLVEKGAWQVFSFGPALIRDGKITVSESSEVRKSMSSNPRTAIGQITPLHYIFIVSDGRTSENAGLSLIELAQEFYDLGCTQAYNLDGGGSSTLWFNGQIINQPANGHQSERRISDIVYIGY